MNNSEVELTAYCGLYCGDCIRYKSKFPDLAQDLEYELRNTRFDKYVEVKSAFVEEFASYRECLGALGAIAKLKCSTPCRVGGDGCLKPCGIKKCVQAKKLEGCWQCDEFEGCRKFEFLEPFSGDVPKENLRKIKEHGLDEWVEHRGKFYVWL